MKYTILDYFEETVEKFPNRTAFSDVNRSISFLELKDAAECFASFLLKNAPEAEAVAFYLDKSVDTLVGFLGSAYAGKPYTQINIWHPAARIRDITRKIAPCVIFTDWEHVDNLKEDQGCPVFLIDEV